MAKRKYGSNIKGERTQKFDKKNYKRQVAVYNEPSWNTRSKATKKAKDWKSRGHVKSYRVVKEQGEFVIYTRERK